MRGVFHDTLIERDGKAAAGATSICRTAARAGVCPGRRGFPRRGKCPAAVRPGLPLVTPAAFEVGRHLIEGLKNPTVVRDAKALDAFPIRPMGVPQAIRRRLADSTS